MSPGFVNFEKQILLSSKGYASRPSSTYHRGLRIDEETHFWTKTLRTHFLVYSCKSQVVRSLLR